MRRTLLLGGPGAGKTTRLIELVEGFIEAGVRPERIAFVAFTRAAAYEARDRAVRRFGLSEDDLPWFRTLHSACYRMLALRHDEVFGQRHREELAELVGESAKEDDLFMALSVRARTTLRGLEAESDESTETIPLFLLDRAEKFDTAYDHYRQDRSVYDFTDMLQMYADRGDPVPVEVAVVDEAQDLSRLQWLVVERAFSGCREVYYAGDDDQAIHVWAGADFARFTSLVVDETVVLPVSHRLPEPVFDLGQEVIGRVSRRYLKEVRSAGKPGELDWVRHPDDVDMSSGSWLLLARTRYQLDELARVARAEGVVHNVAGEPTVDLETVEVIRSYERLRRGGIVSGSDAVKVAAALGTRRSGLEADRKHTAAELGLDVGPIWHHALTKVPLDERDYYVACLERGERLDAPPRVHIDTIHGAKGREADNVLLLTDATSRILKSMRHDEDSEWRVWYVGITRASHALYLVQPRTRYPVRL